MRIHMVACQVFSRELCALAAHSDNVIEFTWLPQGLHDTPARLREMADAAIRQVEERYQKKISKHLPDAIVLGYGLCSNGVVGLTAGEIPLIIPRTDDCIGVFWGPKSAIWNYFGKIRAPIGSTMAGLKAHLFPLRNSLPPSGRNMRRFMGKTTPVF